MLKKSWYYANLYKLSSKYTNKTFTFTFNKKLKFLTRLSFLGLKNKEKNIYDTFKKREVCSKGHLVNNTRNFAIKHQQILSSMIKIAKKFNLPEKVD